MINKWYNFFIYSPFKENFSLIKIIIIRAISKIHYIWQKNVKEKEKQCTYSLFIDDKVSYETHSCFYFRNKIKAVLTVFDNLEIPTFNKPFFIFLNIFQLANICHSWINFSFHSLRVPVSFLRGSRIGLHLLNVGGISMLFDISITRKETCAALLSRKSWKMGKTSS